MPLTLPRKLIPPAKKPVAPATPAPSSGGLRVPGKLQDRAIAPKTAPTSDFSAATGFAKARTIAEEVKRQKDIRSNRAFEFSMKVGEGGVNGVTVIVVDHGPPHFQYTHRWGFEKGERNVEVCIMDGDKPCGLCQSLNKKGNYEMVLTIIDTRPYTYTKGQKAGQTVRRSRKPLVVKLGMMGQYERLFHEHKNLRGAVLRIHRDGDRQSASSGTQVTFIKKLSEQELKGYGDLAKPLDYNVAYPRLTAEKMAEVYQIEGGVIGSSDFGLPYDDIPF